MKAHAEDYRLMAPFTFKAEAVGGFCTFCGSALPDLAAEVIKAGGGLHAADRKYGWPHKFYFDFDGKGGSPRDAKAPIKFYTEHLKDATPEDAEVIQRAMGLRIAFNGGAVEWQRYQPKE